MEKSGMSDHSFPILCTESFSRQNALLLSYAALLVYETETEIRKKLSQWGFLRYQYFDRADSQAFLAEHNKFLILAFRGTESWADAKTDIDIRHVKVRYGSIHRGFKKAFDHVWPEISAALAEYGNSRKKVYITGHSLGGALAVLAAEQFIAGKILDQLAGVYTYGMPRVGNKEFCAGYDIWLRRKTFRFVNNQDIVPRMPRPVTGYAHVGQMMFFDSFGKFHPRYSVLKLFMNEIVDTAMDIAMFYRIFVKKYPDSIRNHFLAEYMKLLEKM